MEKLRRRERLPEINGEDESEARSECQGLKQDMTCVLEVNLHRLRP